MDEREEHESPKKQLGEKIKTARSDKGWKQKHLAAHVEVEPMTVSRWERGATTPDLDVLRLVAEATEKPLSFFVADDAPPAATEPAVRKLERAADKLSEQADRIERLLEEVRAELARTG